MKKILYTLLAVIVLIGLAGAAYIYSGSFDIAADAPHSSMVTKLLAVARERAIATRAKNLDVPKLDDPARIAAGASEYAEMCTGCHLAPGMEDNELRPGLYPQPPELAEANPHADDPGDAARQFWIIKHGIKLTSMPAWGETHDDDTLWNIVAFVRKLPGMTAEQYAALTVDAESAHEAAGHGDHHDAHDDHDDSSTAATPDHQDDDEGSGDHAGHHHPHPH